MAAQEILVVTTLTIAAADMDPKLAVATMLLLVEVTAMAVLTLREIMVLHQMIGGVSLNDN